MHLYLHLKYDDYALK